MHKTPRSWNFLPKAILVVALGLTTLIGYSVKAAVTTDPVGFITLTAVGGPNKLSFWGLSMTMLPEQKGVVATVSANMITDSSAGWTNNQWNYSPAKPYELELTSGTYAGYFDTITNTVESGTVYLSTNIAGVASVGDSYLIRPTWTIGQAFGNPNNSGLQGGSAQANADNISVWDPYANPQAFAIYFYKTNAGSGGSGWRQVGSGSENKGGATIPLGGTTVILRLSSTPFNWAMPQPFSN